MLARPFLHTTRVVPADDFKAAARISSAATRSERLLAAPSETPIAWGCVSSTLNVSAVTTASPRL